MHFCHYEPGWMFSLHPVSKQERSPPVMERTRRLLATGWHIWHSAVVTHTEMGKSPGTLPTARMVDLNASSVFPVSSSGLWIQWKR